MKAKFGAIVVDGRGKLGGHVFAKNRSGNYMRTKVTPVNPQSTYQQAQRSAFGTLSSGWSGLSDAQRDAWNGAVDSFQKTDIFGDLKSPTGKNLYTSLNLNLLSVGESIIDTPPTPDSIPSISITSADALTGTTVFPIVNSGDTTGSFVQAWATPSLSPGTSFIKNRLRLLGSFAGGDPATIDIWSAYTARFGAPVAGQNVYVALRVINENGEAGVLVTFKADIAVS